MRPSIERLYRTPRGRVWMLSQALLVRAVGGLAVGRALRQHDGVILVHQPGKVGSKAIQAWAHAAFPGHAVIHTHRLSRHRRREELLERLRTPRRWAPPLAWGVAGSVHRRLGDGSLDGVTVVCATRDPVERDVSAFLQTPHAFTSRQVARAILAATASEEEVFEHYVADYPLGTASAWYDDELFGVLEARPVTSTTGPGPLLVSSDHPGVDRIVVLRKESLTHDIEEVGAALGARPAAVPRVNTTGDKPQGGYLDALLAMHRGTLFEPQERLLRSDLFRALYGESWVDDRVRWWQGDGT